MPPPPAPQGPWRDGNAGPTQSLWLIFMSSEKLMDAASCPESSNISGPTNKFLVNINFYGRKIFSCFFVSHTDPSGSAPPAPPLKHSNALTPHPSRENPKPPPPPLPSHMAVAGRGVPSNYPLLFLALLGGRGRNNVSYAPSTAPAGAATQGQGGLNDRTNVICMGPPENGTAKFHSSERRRNKVADLGPARCAYRGQRRRRTWQSHRAAPQASPSVYTARDLKAAETALCAVLTWALFSQAGGGGFMSCCPRVSRGHADTRVGGSAKQGPPSSPHGPSIGPSRVPSSRCRPQLCRCGQCRVCVSAAP